MHKAILFMSFLGLFFSCHSQKKTSPQNDLASFIQRKGDSLLKAESVPGIFVGLLNKGKREYYSFGFAIPDEKKPFDAEMVFEAGSITKTFTAYIVESILQEKDIPDTTSIISYLPDPVRTNEALAPVTFRSLLNHTSGLPRLPENMELSNEKLTPYDNYTENDLFAYLKLAQPKPDGKSHYSNLGMGLAGVLAQQITGKTFMQLLKEYVFTPFAMKASDGTSGAIKIQGYFDSEKTPYWHMNILAPAGGLHLTADEMLSYLQYMSNPRAPKAKATVEHLLQPTIKLSPTMLIGKAWHMLQQKNKPTIYWHNGGTFGFSTFAAFNKDTEHAVIVVVNQFNKNNVSDGFGIAIMKEMLDEK